MLQLITQRLQSLQSSGQWDQTMDAFKQRVIENSQRPAPVEGIKRAEKYEQRWFDPSIRLTEDLKDNEGRVFARKGDVVNPLKTVPFVQTLYFINGGRCRPAGLDEASGAGNPDEQNYPGARQYP
ncbi:type IV conjugative transfer system protein TraW [Klebsiella aerogenes]|nr:type IV conjugative transfer system protein TraW [Klebsiella aerogenes]